MRSPRQSRIQNSFRLSHMSSPCFREQIGRDRPFRATTAFPAATSAGWLPTTARSMRRVHPKGTRTATIRTTVHGDVTIACTKRAQIVGRAGRKESRAGSRRGRGPQRVPSRARRDCREMRSFIETDEDIARLAAEGRVRTGHDDQHGKRDLF